MIKEAIEKILGLAPPNIHTVGVLDYTDKRLDLIFPPSPKTVECSTLQGLVDLHQGELDDAMSKGDLLVHITSPTEVELISRESDDHGRRRVWAKAEYPRCESFTFGKWLDPENFIIAAQQGFQRVKVEDDDGSFVKDLDYVLGVASKISAEHATENEDDGFAQRVAVRQGVALKSETVLRPMVNLAPYRTFAEIDQVLSQFVFRARVANGQVNLALFEGDGGRWKLAAVAAIKEWLKPEFGDVPVIS
ncbi:MAG: hypothetical protein LAN84_00430 [Acidobacteriia bacterium]|nr:hypothetical protein [Terriglobia bacterium]